MKIVNGSGNGGGWTGVTIGIGPYRGRAEIAAGQFAKWTGNAAVIVEDCDLDTVRALTQAHCPVPVAEQHVPYMAKLFLFDLCPQERLVYFDADWVCLRPWSHALFDDPACLYATRDFWWNSAVLQDCRVWNLNPDQYFSTGFMILSRGVHIPWLRESAALYGRAETALPEQALLNCAAQRLNLTIRFLPRDQNLIEAPSSDEMGEFGVVGAHLMSHYPEDRYKDFIGTYENRGISSVEPARADMERRWMYVREGIGTRPMEFRSDGTIGTGSCDCERYWRVWHAYGQPVLGVFGHAGGESRMTMTFNALRDGDGWRGRWLRFEQCAVLLRPLNGD